MKSILFPPFPSLPYLYTDLLEHSHLSFTSITLSTRVCHTCRPEQQGEGIPSLFPSRVLACQLYSCYLEDKRLRQSNGPCGHYNQCANRSSTLPLQKCELIGSVFRVLLMERRSERMLGQEVLKDQIMIFLPGIGLSRVEKVSVALQLE